MSEKKNNHGGARPGSGVKPGHKVRYRKKQYNYYSRGKVAPAMKRELFTCRLPLYIIMWLEQQKESCGRIVEQAILEKYPIDPDTIVGVKAETSPDHYAPCEWEMDELQELVDACNTANLNDDGDNDER